MALTPEQRDWLLEQKRELNRELDKLVADKVRPGYVDKNAMVSADVDITFSSTNGQVMATLFRLQNATASPITWSPSFYFSCYGGWGEWASVAVNGANVWTSGGGAGVSQATASFSLPANTTSTVIFTAAPPTTRASMPMLDVVATTLSGAPADGDGAASAAITTSKSVLIACLRR